jgi:hypothetical protein
VALWFNGFLESKAINDPEAAVARSRRRLAAAVAAL